MGYRVTSIDVAVFPRSHWLAFPPGPGEADPSRGRLCRIPIRSEARRGVEALMTHTFQFDPNTILGVPSGASLSEIREAYHQKSLKHHPDRGGDEWAFRMVARSYEILSTARVVNRVNPPPTTERRATPRPETPPTARPSWTSRFRPGGGATTSATAEATDARSAPSPPPPNGGAQAPFNPGESKGSTGPKRDTTDLSGWGKAAQTHESKTPEELARIVAAELLILRFELECSLDLFARNPEDRNLSCTLHLTWPLDELVERAEPIPDSARTLKALEDAFKTKAVRKLALTKRSQTEGGRFVGWLTYPTAVMASEALEAFREAIKSHGMTVEKQVREMALPRQW